MKDQRHATRLLSGLATAGTITLLTIPATAQQHQHPPAAPDHMEHRFDPEASTKSFDDPARDEWQMPSRVIDALGLRPDSAVADVGAGTGYFTMRLARAVPQGVVYAVDIEPKMLDFIRQRAREADVRQIVTVQAAASSPNLPKPVDVVLVVNTYHHIPNRPVYFRDLQRSLKPGGAVAIVDFRKDAPNGPPPEFRFEASRIQQEMESAGYRLEQQHDFLPRQLFLVFRPGVAAPTGGARRR
jgi:predicted methyltransferase